MPVFNYALLFWPFIAAVLYDIFVGEYPTAIHPVALMGRFISKGSGLADRCTSRSGRFFAGAAVVLSGIVIFSLPAAVLWGLFNSSVFCSVKGVILFLIISFYIKSSFSIKGLLSAAATVVEALELGDLYEARNRTARHLVSRDTSELSEDEIAAAVIESIAENLTDSVVSPWVFYLIGGPAGAVGYRFVNTCDSMLGYRNEKYEWLGKFAARLDDVLNFIPARISALLIFLSAAITPGQSGRGTLKTILRDHRVTDSPNAGWTMSAAAGALGVRLVKNDFYEINGGSRLPDASDIKRAVVLIRRAVIISAVLVPIMMLILSGILI